jgi:class 3 adenylate cyclase
VNYIFLIKQEIVNIGQTNADNSHTYDNLEPMTYMVRLEKFIYFLFPDLLIAATPWHQLWKNREKNNFYSMAKILLPVIAIVYVGHYFFFDKVMKLSPIEHWFRFRFTMAILAALAASFYFYPIKFKYYKLPFMLMLSIVCITQAKVCVWYPQAPYLYASGFTYLSAILLRSSTFKSILFASIILAIQTPILIQAGVQPPLVASSAAVIICMVGFSRAGYLTEIRYFIANHQNIDSQIKIIEINKEYTNQIKSFLPKEIARRLDLHTSERRLSVLQATDEVLRPRKKNVACLFSDIRGFSQSSKDLDVFVNQGVIPTVKECTEAIESVGGIQRKIGDLIFAYFDDEGVHANILNALTAGFGIVGINERFNLTNPLAKIERFVLVSSGEAIVGNVGGFNSSIEITALGSPVNFLSRLDSITKSLNKIGVINSRDILMDIQTAEIASKMIQGLKVKMIDLTILGIKIRDFEDVKMICSIEYNTHNQNLIDNFYNYVDSIEMEKAS